ncbi:hypothetical protein BV898_18000 [Hypsibius exemplaris]|uniref:Uncharacterized protein n=1 Tax=Hypsibius exemplaris TaxID=2072580 RepID=A0A9X6NGF5_HYPEX|nr:hypothetical protein BV898_18000 [Hypsibius exemplaris]
MSFQSLIVGCIHVFFGITLIGLQIACFIMEAYWNQIGLLYVKWFAPGAWLGGFILITGIMGIVHGCNYGRGGSKTGCIRGLRTWIIAFNIVVVVQSVIMLAQTIRFQMLYPGRLIADCTVYQAELWIYNYDTPYCEAKNKITVMGLIMGAVACFEAIFALAGAIIVREADNEFIRRG